MDTGGRLETFNAPPGVAVITFNTDEVYASCPLTGQPDFYSLSLEYMVNKKCIESKSLKLYIQSLATLGIFGEGLASKIAKDAYDVLEAKSVKVTLTQKPRGGISIVTECYCSDKNRYTFDV